MDHNELSPFDRLRSLRNNLDWTLRGQVGFLLLFWFCFLLSAQYLSTHDSNLNSAESNLLPFPLLGIVTMIIASTVFCGGWLMKIVITKQELEKKKHHPEHADGALRLFSYFHSIVVNRRGTL